MSTLLLNHVAVNDINSSQRVSPFSTPPGSGCLTGGLGGCLGGDGPLGGLGGGGVGYWPPRADYTSEADPCLMSYDASSAAVVAAARFMQGYRNHHQHYQQQQQQQPTAVLPHNSSTSTSSG